MTKLVSVVLASAALLALGASSATALTQPKGATPAADPAQCFASRNVNNYAQQDSTTVNIRVGVRDFYQLSLLQPCPDITFSRGIGFSSQSQFICSGIDVDLIIPDAIGDKRCNVRSIRRLSPEEAAALPPKAKP